ncbi:hypothetical protein BDP81DRAFT_424485 [Colletotrichum phormii]|uniref:Secreted protein n=1 Tax=Colletotrichum phormii TaxID=359342 RepID=A0AAJ0EGK6_9PEZI|nr:uncharacterized protein BDP81DRAFT_424485 [Colletotrichum phormii]KAK1638228.1 hypothetical protein BDP81DRAFT_424485 [Colletotrichum phormii]
MWSQSRSSVLTWTFAMRTGASCTIQLTACVRAYTLPYLGPTARPSAHPSHTKTADQEAEENRLDFVRLMSGSARRRG